MEHRETDRRRSVTISEEELDAFLDRAIERTANRFFAEVGRSVLKKLAWIVGAAVVGGYLFAKNKGWL